MLTLEEFTLREAFEPIETEYGVNPPLFNDKRIVPQSEGIDISFYIFKYRIYSIQYRPSDGEIGFGKSETIPKTIKELADLRVDTNLVGDGDGLGVFNRSFYVFLMMIENIKANKFYFKSNNEKLVKLYGVLLSNKNFSDKLKSLGFKRKPTNGIENYYVREEN